MKSQSETEEMESAGAIGRWKPYAKYKDSGVAWLGEVPEHWEITKVKYGFEIKLGKMLRPEPLTVLDTLEPYLRAANVYWEGIDIADIQEMWFSPWEKHQYEIGRGDLIVCEGGDVGRAAIWEGELEKCYIQNAVHRVRNKTGFLNNYLLYWLLTLKSKGYIDLLCSKATIAHFTAEKFQALDLVIPPLGEQMVIIDFLDYETGKIDTLIEKKQRLIELLQEKRTSLISQAVTKGLNLNVPMKESGLEWLGEMPEDWSLQKNGYLFSERDERGFPELPLLNVSIHTGVSLREFSTEHIEQMAADWATYKKACKNDIAFNKMRMWQGAVGVTPEDGLVSPDYIVAKPKDNVNPFFYEYLFRTSAYREEINRSSHGIVPDRNRLYWDQFKDMLSINPPKIVQDTIVEYLNDNIRKIDILIQRIEIVIENLHKYRSALITAAVTGQIDVRDHTPKETPYDL